MDECILTVYCMAYNHAEYIENTLKGFVSQKTKYKYQVIVHDDASADGTADIIRKYAEQYPDIIKPILQKENQYSQGKKIFVTFIEPLVKSKYIASCEGDDFWSDDSKLEQQLDYMENHPECSLCVHNTELINEDGSSRHAFINKRKKEADFSTDEIIRSGGSGLFHTSSFLYRFELRKNKPKDFAMRGIGDYPLAIYLSTKGTVHYLPQVMSKYRLASKSSWTRRLLDSKELFMNTKSNNISDLKKLDMLTEYKYTDSFQIAERRVEYQILVHKKKLGKILFDKKYRPFLFEKGFKRAMRTIAKIMLK